MSYNTGAKIVTDGLVLCLDAGNTKSYPGSGTTWTDISRNGNNGTLTNGPIYNSSNGGSIAFDGVNDEIVVTGTIVTSTATSCAWIRRSGTQPNYGAIIHNRGGSNVTAMNFYINNQLGYHWNNASNTYNWASSLVVPDLTWCMCAVSVSATFATAYLCQASGISSATNVVSHGSTTLNVIRIANDTNGGRYFIGNIAQSLIYNRALSESEIIQNYNATKKRFGL
jgi:hypothetical protein